MSDSHKNKDKLMEWKSKKKERRSAKPKASFLKR